MLRIICCLSLALVLSTTLISAEGDEGYPNLSCHEGYKAENHVVKYEGKYKHSRGADFYVKSSHANCQKKSEEKDFCLKKCVLDRLGVLNLLSTQDDTPKDIELFFNPLEKGKEFTEKIKTSCTDSYKQVEQEEKCDKWEPFFECVDNLFKDCPPPPAPKTESE